MDYDAKKSEIKAKILKTRIQIMMEQQEEKMKDTVRETAKEMLQATFFELRLLEKTDNPHLTKTFHDAQARIPKLQRMMSTGVPEVLFTPN